MTAAELLQTGAGAWKNSDRHNVKLPSWGPYGKKYLGVSHVPDNSEGIRLDLTLCPGIYRKRVYIPTARFDSGTYASDGVPTLETFEFHHEMLGKQDVYLKSRYHQLADHAVRLNAQFHNTQAWAETLELHCLANINFPPLEHYSNEPLRPANMQAPASVKWIEAIHYDDIRIEALEHRSSLTEDATILGEVRAHQFVQGQGLGDGFGALGDRLCYRTLPERYEALLIRYQNHSSHAAELMIQQGTSKTVALNSSADIQELIVEGPFYGDTLIIDVCEAANLTIDGFAMGTVNTLRETNFQTHPLPVEPIIKVCRENHSLNLKWEELGYEYTLGWDPQDFQIRKIFSEELETILPLGVNAAGRGKLHGVGSGFYTDLFIRPIAIPAASQHQLSITAVFGDEEALDKVRHKPNKQHPQTGHAFNESGSGYDRSQALMRAVCSTNVIYPVRIKGGWIKHHTPGRWWDTLYTWDSGFIALGMLELDLEMAANILSAYLTDAGDPQAAFVHHGTPVPVQIYVFKELLDRGYDKDFLRQIYPCLLQYHHFLAGHAKGSTTNNLSSGLIRTWDYFYNSGGWDDYPPQHYMLKHQHLWKQVTPVANTAHAIRTARILKDAAMQLEIDVDPLLSDDIQRLEDALQEHAWDSESGYFSYVEHDADGKTSHFRDPHSGENFNQGLDGVTPLFAAAVNQEQQDILVDKLFNKHHLWSDIGITAVDRSAPYYSREGYWNGTVWMPHAWFAWKSMLDIAKPEYAWNIAQSALNLWRDEVGRTNRCFEHFIIETGRGAGWPQFSGLSTPVLSYYSAYYKPGTVTVGFDSWITQKHWNAKEQHLGLKIHACPHANSSHHSAIICLEAGKSYQATLDAKTINIMALTEGVFSIDYPADSAEHSIEIRG